VVFDGDGDVALGGEFEVGLHLFNEFGDFLLEVVAGEAARADGTGDDGLAAEAFGEREFVFQAKGAEDVLSDAAERDLMFLEQLAKFVFAHFGELLALVAVDFGPDVDGGGTGAGDFGEDFLQFGEAVHAGAEDVFEVEIFGGLQPGELGGGEGQEVGGAELAAGEA